MLRVYESLPDHGIRILNKNGSAYDIMDLVLKNPARTVVAFDFDQTLTVGNPNLPKAAGHARLSLRGGAKTRQALEEMKALGVRCCVITAQPPSIPNVRNMAKELQRLQIAQYFNVQPVSLTPLFQLLQSWGSNDAMSLSRLQKKCLITFCLATKRWPGDVSRVGYTGLEDSLRPHMATYWMAAEKDINKTANGLILEGPDYASVTALEDVDSPLSLSLYIYIDDLIAVNT